MSKDIKENWAKIIDEIGCLKDKPMTRMLLGNLVRKTRREALANQKKELREKIEEFQEEYKDMWTSVDYENDFKRLTNQLLK